MFERVRDTPPEAREPAGARPGRVSSSRRSGRQVVGRRLLQPKLVVGSVDDPFEREADRIADQVMSSIGAGQTSVGQSLDGRPTRVRRMPGPVGEAGGPLDADTERDVLASSGRPLEPGIRASMEGAFGADFSSVRMHLGPQSDALNERIQARAFTLGTDIFVRRSDYSPGSATGQRLIAHELAHTVQQGGAGVARSPERGSASPTLVETAVGGRSKIALQGADGVVGTVSVEAGAGDAAHATDLEVDPRHRGLGFGQELVAAAANAATRSGKSRVRLGSQDAGSGRLDAWYQSLGFEAVGSTPQGFTKFEASAGKLRPSRVQRSAGTPAPTRVPAAPYRRVLRASDPMTVRRMMNYGAPQMLGYGGGGDQAGAPNPMAAMLDDEPEVDPAAAHAPKIPDEAIAEQAKMRQLAVAFEETDAVPREHVAAGAAGWAVLAIRTASALDDLKHGVSKLRGDAREAKIAVFRDGILQRVTGQRVHMDPVGGAEVATKRTLQFNSTVKARYVAILKENGFDESAQLLAALDAGDAEKMKDYLPQVGDEKSRGEEREQVARGIVDQEATWGAGRQIFVMDGAGVFYVGESINQVQHHSSFLAGGAVAAAGEVVVARGVIKLISNVSGHYRPGAAFLWQAVRQLQIQHADLATIDVEILEAGTINAAVFMDAFSPLVPDTDERHLPFDPAAAAAKVKAVIETKHANE